MRNKLLAVSMIVAAALLAVIRCASAADMEAVLDDAAGASAFSVKDSGNADVAHIDSNGNIVLKGGLRLDAAGVECATAENLIVDGKIGIANDSPTPLLHIGTAGTTLGTMGLAGSASGLVTIQPQATAGTWTLTLPADAGAADQFLRTDGSGVTTWQNPDPWTYLYLSSNFTTTSSTAANVTGLAFTPEANSRYEIRGMFMVRTATTTVGPRPGCAWPTGMTDGVATFVVSSSATAQVMANGNINAAVLCPVGGLPSTTLSYPAQFDALLVAGASPSGTFRVQLASETSGTTVTMVAGSYLKYRKY